MIVRKPSPEWVFLPIEMGMLHVLLIARYGKRSPLSREIKLLLLRLGTDGVFDTFHQTQVADGQTLPESVYSGGKHWLTPNIGSKCANSQLTDTIQIRDSLDYLCFCFLLPGCRHIGLKQCNAARL